MYSVGRYYEYNRLSSFARNEIVCLQSFYFLIIAQSLGAVDYKAQPLVDEHANSFTHKLNTQCFCIETNTETSAIGIRRS